MLTPCRQFKGWLAVLAAPALFALPVAAGGIHRKTTSANYTYNYSPATQSGSAVDLPPIEIEIAPEKIVVCSDDSDSCRSDCGKQGCLSKLFGHKGSSCRHCDHHSKKAGASASASSVPNVATLVTPVMFAAQSSQTTQQSSVQQVQVVRDNSLDLSTIQAAQQVELALANLRGQAEAQKAVQAATQQTIDRLKKQLDSLSDAVGPGPKDPANGESSEELVTVVTQLKEKVDAVVRLATIHDEVLKKMHEKRDDVEPTSEINQELRRTVEFHEKALKLILKDMGYNDALESSPAPKK